MPRLNKNRTKLRLGHIFCLMLGLRDAGKIFIGQDSDLVVFIYSFGPT